MLNTFQYDDLIIAELKEDIAYIDAATEFVIGDNSKSGAEIVAKSDGVLSGIKVAERVFKLVDDTILFKNYLKDGKPLTKGARIATISGDTHSLLKAERTALNFLQHMSGIATATAACVAAVNGTNARVTDTRKTLPGLRRLQKYAVLCGGGRNHRYDLSSGGVLKENHIKAAGGITKAVTLFRQKQSHMTVLEVEVTNLKEFNEALSLGVPVIMLDNMTLADMKSACTLNKGQAVIEASGGITLENIAAVAATGVDIISIGALTHSAKAADITMLIAS
ncbi:MAG: carboxylating nicotinate-nucleotide diphosphorylase [Oscillospiraceae bacterium]|jgi:nicotinate-nucleotide pyrophosphorylase (carboxylating)|nr:carboxylating nicotinate-nucleotide diphosphorylase [Oscillospiraceae bacterium]